VVVEEKARAEVVAGKQAGGEEGEGGQDVGVDLKNDDDAIEQELKSSSPLHGVEWYRVVLDEAHRIKAWSSSTSYAANALGARFRWCLTGTPLQNRLGDLYSMLRFLRWRPWAYYFCSAPALRPHRALGEASQKYLLY
jgi:DNA repair protein RAD16